MRLLVRLAHKAACDKETANELEKLSELLESAHLPLPHPLKHLLILS